MLPCPSPPFIKNPLLPRLVLKSDNANGLFSFHGDSCVNGEIVETEDLGGIKSPSNSLSCQVTRQRGDAGTVNVFWTIVQILV